MISRSRIQSLGFASLAALLACSPIQGATIPANDENIVYSGRIDDSTPEAVTFSYSGARVRMAFEGSSVGAYVDDLRKQNWVVVYVDGQRQDKLSIDGTGGYYELASDLAPGPHTVELVKVTEGDIGSLRFHGFEIPDEGQALPWPEPETRRIEFIGDSITCGYGIEAADKNQGFTADEENFSDTYAFHTVQNLDADYLVVARSGIGMLRNYDGPVDGSVNNMPAIYDRTLFRSAEPKWDTTRFTPDVVCINLCTNDFSTSGPNVEKFESNYTEFVHRIQAQYPAAKIVLLLGPMTNDPKIRTILERIAANTNSEANPVSFFELSAHGKYGFGAHYHPSRKQAEVNGNELSAYLSDLMDWELNDDTTPASPSLSSKKNTQSPLSVAQVAVILENTKGRP
jgi:lysophospholipase L1-like esterase